MTSAQAPVLEFPAMLHGPIPAIQRGVRTRSHQWAREYLKTGRFTQPRQMRQVLPGEVLLMHSAAEFLSPPDSWRVYLFINAFTDLDERIPEEDSSRTEEAFESFCLSTPWGALYHAVTPPPVRSATRMARRLAALERFWDELQGPRYAYRGFDLHPTLDDLMDHIYRKTFEAWCPGGPTSIREHMTLAIERMTQATREDCMEAVLRVIPSVVEVNRGLKHREMLHDPEFLRERLAALPLKDFEDFSSAYLQAVNGQLYAWVREQERH